MQERKRGCGYRKVGGTYIIGGYVTIPCDRLPYLLDVCPVCGSGVKVSRGFTKIIPSHLFGKHNPCEDKFKPCIMCDPTSEPAFIMNVGEKFYPTPDAFIREAEEMGISKRIPFIPRELILGKTVLYLSHPKACTRHTDPAQYGMLEDVQPKMIDADEKAMGIFTAFIPQKIEELIWEKDATPEEIEKLEKRGITPVIIKDGDTDHM